MAGLIVCGSSMVGVGSFTRRNSSRHDRSANFSLHDPAHRAKDRFQAASNARAARKTILVNAWRATAQWCRRIAMAARGGRLRSLSFQAAHSPRMRQAGRAAAAAAREGLFFMALALAALTIDARAALWSRWLPIPLMTLAILWLALETNPAAFAARAVVWMGVALSVLAVRAWLSVSGPLPAAGLAESLGLAVLFMCAAGLWLKASVQPPAALGHWTSALVLAWTTSLVAGRAEVAAAYGQQAPWLLETLALPPQMVAGLSALAGAAFIVAWRIRVARRATPLAPAGRRRAARHSWIVYLVYPLAGAAVGGWLASIQQPSALQGGLALHEGFRVQETLWFRSLLTGWGEQSMARLVDAFAGERTATLPEWGGPVGFLARFGVGGLMLLIAWGLTGLVRARRLAHGQSAHEPAARDAHALDVASPALACSLAMSGVAIGGGPRTMLVLFVLGGWTALALAAPPGGTPEPRRARAPLAAASALALAGLALSLLLGMPTWGKAIQRAALRSGEQWAVTERRLLRARALNPYDPSIAVALATVKRNEMNASPGWNDSLYTSVVNYYRDARTLDPYDPLIAMRLSQFQLLCDRDEEAFASIREALETQPRSTALVDYFILTAIGRGHTSLAMEMIQYGLRLDPRRADWWQHRSALARRLGQGPTARRALGLALSAAPDDPERVRQAWALIREGQGPGVQLTSEESISSDIK
jgi:hypothetical protein